MAKKELKRSKKAEEAVDEDDADEGDDGATATARSTSAEERRARMRERRVASAADDHDDHGHDDHGHGHGHDSHDEDEEIDTTNDPSWWAPHAVMGALVLLGIFGFFGVFNSLAAKAGYKGMPNLASHEASHDATPTHETKPAEPQPQPPPRAQPQPPREMFGAKHLLVMYKGSMRAPANVTRTKDEAKARAEEALKKAKAGTKFEDLVAEYSDEPGAGQRGGDLGKFPKGRMVGAFQEGLEKTKVGQVSDLVETPFGYHVILRTQ